MTCEVAVANKLAIALAADSAVTFSTQDNQNTYATGANKIFQLAHAEPVAVMIYNSAVIASVPWEIILKAYRAKLGTAGFKRINDYCVDLVKFVNECPEDLIHPDLKAASAVETYRHSILFVVRNILAMQPILEDDGADDEALRTAWSEGIDAARKMLQAEVILDGLDERALEMEVAAYRQQFSDEIRGYLEDKKFARFRAFIDEFDLAALGIEAAFKFGPDIAGSQYTGIVIAGFGIDDYLPGYCDMRFFGFVGNRILCKPKEARAVNHNGTSSIIEAFARRAMVETFTQGASPEVWHAVGSAYETFAQKVCEEAVKAAGVEISAAEISKQVTAHRSDFTKTWTIAVFDEHLKPLWRVVAGLSVAELAELAETLVLLDSLKEKVTQRTQSVGGPIDVAVITKAEGLVWIKRKLYFEPRLNHRYFNRIEIAQGVHRA